MYNGLIAQTVYGFYLEIKQILQNNKVAKKTDELNAAVGKQWDQTRGLGENFNRRDEFGWTFQREHSDQKLSENGFVKQELVVLAMKTWMSVFRSCLNLKS